MGLPSGYRFFRDDSLLDIRAKETRYCERCERLYWIDESQDSYVVEKYCQECLGLIRSRTSYLIRGDRTYCPINSGKFIFKEGLHIKIKHRHRGTIPYKEYLKRKKLKEENKNGKTD